MTYDTNQLTRASAIHISIRWLLMEVATFWQIGEKRVCTGGHESDGYPCILWHGTHFWRQKYRNIGILHVKRCTRQNYVKWRPIVTKFGTMIDNMSRMRLHEYHILKIFVDDFMRNCNFGIGVLHVKVKYWRIFCNVISLLARVFIVSSNRVS